jgi:hypothetical protein
MTPKEIDRLFKSNSSLYDFAAALEAATIERVAQWYASKGWLMDEGDVADAIRAIAKEKS